LLKRLNISAVNIANNHIQDKGDEGIIETIDHLDQENIAHFGAGKNIIQAKEPFRIGNDLYLLGYCDFGRSYLKNVQIATEVIPGVNPLRIDSILEDLDRMPKNSKAILFFHWGREHVWLPPMRDIQLAKRMLDHENVLMIVGVHCHRIQGYLEHNGKRAYLSLGNFLFPNFFIQPPNQIYYPSTRPEKFAITRQYHRVNNLTYKKWRIVNRISLLVSFDPDTLTYIHKLTYQDDNTPDVSEVGGLIEKTYQIWIYLLNLSYKFPEPVYKILEITSNIISYSVWYIQIVLFYLTQNGILWTLKFLHSKIFHQRE